MKSVVFLGFAICSTFVSTFASAKATHLFCNFKLSDGQDKQIEIMKLQSGEFTVSLSGPEGFEKQLVVKEKSLFNYFPLSTVSAVSVNEHLPSSLKLEVTSSSVRGPVMYGMEIEAKGSVELEVAGQTEQHSTTCRGFLIN